MAAPAGPPARPWGPAFCWLLFLGPFFFTTYGFANWMASRRAEVGAVVFAWEHAIPFVAWTIVPYWSIDLLYALSVFACATRVELGVHARRLLTAQVICVACFLLFPLRFTFSRPPAGGLAGVLFDTLAGFDKPFNQAPSLHIALLVILWARYLAHASGPWRLVEHAWFALIGVSVLTTYQHHFVDVPTGAWVGWLCVWLLPEGHPSPLAGAAFTRDPRRRALAARYAMGAVAVAALALGLGGWALWLLWGAGALALVAAIYAGLDATAFQKDERGAMSAAAAWLLAPYRLAAWLNSRWWTRTAPGPAVVVPGLLLGRVPTRGERARHGVRAIVDVCAELPCPGAGVRYVAVPQLDLVSPSVVQVARSVRAIEDMFPDGPVLVCCALGFSRSAVAVAGWLLATGRAADAAEAIALVRRARPAAVLGDGHLAVLDAYARAGAPAAA